MEEKRLKYVILTCLLYLCSFLGLIYWILRPSLIAAMVGLPFYLLILSIFHESGHVLGCLINKNKVTGITVSSFSLREGRILIEKYPSIYGSCSFIRKEKNAIVFMGGPVVSILLSGVLLMVASSKWTLPGTKLYAAVTVIHCVRNLVPLYQSDMKQFIQEINKGATQ